MSTLSAQAPPAPSAQLGGRQSAIHLARELPPSSTSSSPSQGPAANPRQAALLMAQLHAHDSDSRSQQNGNTSSGSSSQEAAGLVSVTGRRVSESMAPTVQRLSKVARGKQKALSNFTNGTHTDDDDDEDDERDNHGGNNNITLTRPSKPPLIRSKSEHVVRHELPHDEADAPDYQEVVYEWGARHGFEDHYQSEDIISQLANVGCFFIIGSLLSLPPHGSQSHCSGWAAQRALPSYS
ncbi:hypothetical protein B0H63DRAFT_286514 [Podospora didyma]|uniref:Uncharacterized protein n=1 Tax=Podospora didyma TaxID=330526 RepID=A0AAE0N6J7_9PEZI|nr:hypothetical protein B0H63DRAFT_286514 [Podospora didyma]